MRAMQKIYSLNKCIIITTTTIIIIIIIIIIITMMMIIMTINVKSFQGRLARH